MKFERPEPLKNDEFSSWSSISATSSNYLDELLNACRMPGKKSIYVVGSFDNRKTIERQQMRGASVALALANQSREAPFRVAIVGGGFAGVTAAATLLRMGHEVWMFEAGPRMLNLQWSCNHRFLHPSNYDWPKTDWKDDVFDISGLSWRADYASGVVKQVFNAFSSVQASAVGKFKFLCYKDIFRFRESNLDDGTTKVSLFEKSKFQEFADFDHVLLCAGFGVEATKKHGIATPSYWGGTPIDEYDDRSGGRLRKVLVSGTGDGGLIDVLRTALSGLS